MKIFALILAILTQKDRYFPEIQWSSSLVCNIFRCYEAIFGRRVGIRPEQVTSPAGITYSYTWENLFATWEGIALAWLKGKIPKFKVVWLPEMQMAGVTRGGIRPFALAIAFDTTAAGTQGSASPATWNHTVTGSNPAILIAYNHGALTDLSTDASYNAVSGTKIAAASGNATAFGVALWYLQTASTGTNQVKLTYSASDDNRSMSASYSGCATSADTGGLTGNVSLSSPGSLTITSVADNCWLAGMAVAGAAAMAAGTNTTQRGTAGDQFGIWVDGNAVIHPAGSSTIQVTWSGTNSFSFYGTTIAPAAAAASATVKVPDIMIFN